MKKFAILLSVISLFLGGAALMANSNMEMASAAEESHSHLFLKVEREEDLRVGDTVFISTTSGTALGGLSGNPVFSSEEHAPGSNEDGSKFYMS